VAVVATAFGGLGALHVVVRTQVPEPGRDVLTLPYLRAWVDRRPHDEAMRLRLAREQLTLSRYKDAERTLAPLLQRGSAPPGEASRLQLEIAVAAWRAAPAKTLERAGAEAKLLQLLASLVRDATPGEHAHLAALARELGRPDLAAQAAERAASLDGTGCAAWLQEAARDYLAAARQDRAAASYARACDCAGHPQLALAMGLEALATYQAADMGREALRFAHLLVERFPSDREVLERAVAIALAQDERGAARRFGARLMDIGAADAASLRRQLDLALAAGDLDEALRVTSEMVRREPADERSRLTAANVASWAGRRRLALRHWAWLARRDGTAGVVEEALRLARAVQDSAAVAELLTLKSRMKPLSATSLAELADALERVGPPGRALAALEEHAQRHPGDKVAWEQLATFQERRRDLPGALSTRSEFARRFGPTLVDSIRLAQLQWALDRPGDALAEARRWVDVAEPDEVEYWQLLAELAWDQEVDDVASRAYDVLWKSERIDSLGTERLLLLSRAAGRPEAVIRYGREGWSRFRQARLLLIAMDEAARVGRWDDLGQLVDESASAASAFARIPAYWMLRARLDASRGRRGRAIEDYRQALVADPKSAASRSGLIWLLAGAHDREALSRCLAGWASDAWSDPALWHAYAAGLEELGRRREALSFYEREARADPDDEEAMQRYAQALARAGERAAAAELSRRSARRRAAPAVALASAQPRRATVAATPAWRGLTAAAPVPAVQDGAGATGRVAATFGAELGLETLGPLTLQRQRAAVRSDVLGVELEARAERTGFNWRGAILPVDREESGVLLRAAFAVLEGWTEVSGGLRLRLDGSVLQGGLAHTHALSSFAEGRLETSLNEPADESALLRLEAVRRRVGGALTLSAGSMYARGGADWKSWSTWSGTAVGTGGVATMELGVRIELTDAELRVRLQGSQQRNWLRASSGSAVLAASGRILPDELTTFGLGAAAARWPVGPAQLTADAWLGAIFPPVRPAYRVQAGVAMTPFDGAELSLTGFAADDRFGSGRGATASLAYRFRG
jgi:tetratricopeptide (TPR) repeat protein